MTSSTSGSRSASAVHGKAYEGRRAVPRRGTAPASAIISGTPMAGHERGLEPLEREDPGCGAAAHAPADGRDAPLDVAHALVGALRRPTRSPDHTNRVEHARHVVCVEGEDRGAGDVPGDGGRRVRRRYSTHLAYSLGQNQVGPRGGQTLGLDLVDAAEPLERGAHGGVDLAAREPCRLEARTTEDRLAADLAGVVTAVRHAHQSVAQP